MKVGVGVVVGVVDADFEMADVAAHHVDFAIDECAGLASTRKDVETLLDLEEEGREINEIAVGLSRGNGKDGGFGFEYLVESSDDQTVVPHRETDELWVIHSHPGANELLAHRPVSIHLFDPCGHHEVPTQKVFGYFGQLLGLECQELQQEDENGGDVAHGRDFSGCQNIVIPRCRPNNKCLSRQQHNSRRSGCRS